MLSVRREGNAAETPDMEQGAMLAQSVAGQWGQSECVGRVHDGAGPWWPACPPPGLTTCIAEASWVAQWDRCTGASPSPGVLKTPTSKRADLPTLLEVLPTLLGEIIP